MADVSIGANRHVQVTHECQSDDDPHPATITSGAEESPPGDPPDFGFHGDGFANLRVFVLSKHGVRERQGGRMGEGRTSTSG